MEHNISCSHKTKIQASVMKPTGSGAQHPQMLLQDQILLLHGRPLDQFRMSLAYDTYDGQNSAFGDDWYMLDFGNLAHFNCIEMSMGLVRRDGGWWRDLRVEIRISENSGWQDVGALRIVPDYDFQDHRGNRLPFETYCISFEKHSARFLRLIGKPGGLAEFTSLARIAVFDRDFSNWDVSQLPQAPVPQVFQLLEPGMIWDVIKHFQKLTGLSVEIDLLDCYLTGVNYIEFWNSTNDAYLGSPNLEFLIADTLGWRAWQSLNDNSSSIHLGNPYASHVTLNWDSYLATAITPILVDERTIGIIKCGPHFVNKPDTVEWLHDKARSLDIRKTDFKSALSRTRFVTIDQMNSAATLLGLLANTIANLQNRNRRIVQHLKSSRSMTVKDQKEVLINEAMDFMRTKLEDNMSVARAAEYLNITPAYFSQLFSDVAKINPRDYLTRLRIERAKHYLANSQISITDICITLDMSPSYFSRRFKQETGETLSDYLNKHRK